MLLWLWLCKVPSLSRRGRRSCRLWKKNLRILLCRSLPHLVFSRTNVSFVIIHTFDLCLVTLYAIIAFTQPSTFAIGLDSTSTAAGTQSKGKTKTIVMKHDAPEFESIGKHFTWTFTCQLTLYWRTLPCFKPVSLFWLPWCLRQKLVVHHRSTACLRGEWQR